MSLSRISAALAVTLLAASPAWADVPPQEATAAVDDNLAEPDNRGTPDVFVKSIYDVKLTAEGIRADLGRNTTSHIILYYFTPELLGLYKTVVGFDEPVVDADMFMMAQDWDTKPGTVTTKVVKQDDASASVEATVPSFGATSVVTFSLKKSKTGLWLIDDVTDTHGGGIRQMIGVGLKENGVTP